MLLEVPPIHPVVGYASGWWFVVAGCVLAAVAVLVFGVLRWRALRPVVEPRDDSLERLRAAALDRLAEAARMAEPQDACRAMSRVVRRFVGTASDGDADYASAGQLRDAARIDPRLGPLAALVTELQAVSFSPAADPDVEAFLDRAREVVRAWH